MKIDKNLENKMDKGSVYCFECLKNGKLNPYKNNKFLISHKCELNLVVKYYYPHSLWSVYILNRYNFRYNMVTECYKHGKVLSHSGAIQKCEECRLEERICINCHKRFSSILQLCDECYHKLPCNYDREKENPKMKSLIYCDSCKKYYIGKNPNSSCPTCHHRKQKVKRQCIYCKRIFTTQSNGRKTCDDCLRKKNTCPVCHVNTIDKKCKGVCLECWKTLYANFDKKHPPKAARLLLCQKHGYYLGSNQRVTCNKCYSEFRNRDSKEVKHLKLLLKNKENHMETINNLEILQLPIHNKINESKQSMNSIRICLLCHRRYLAHSAKSLYCGRCFIKHTCKVCHRDFISSNLYKAICSRLCLSHYMNDRTLFPRDDKKIFSRNRKILNSKQQHIQLSDEIKSKLQLCLKNKTLLCDENISQFKIPGIWLKEDDDHNVLDILLTKNIYKEYYGSMYNMEHPRNSKYKEFSKMGNIHSYFITEIDDWNMGLLMEYYIFTLTNAKYWNPAPGIQTLLYYK